MDQNDLAVPEQQEHKNRFIFSDDFYDQLPSDEDINADITKPVLAMPPKVEIQNESILTKSGPSLMDISEQADLSVQQSTNFDNMIQNAYSDESDNLFHFYKQHSTPSELEEENSEIEDVIETEEKQKKGFFPSFEERFGKKQKEQDYFDVVHLDAPVLDPIDPFEITNQMMADNDETSSMMSVQVPIESKPTKVEPFVAPVDATDIGDHLIDNIVDYQALLTEPTQEDNVGKFIVNDDPNISVVEKKIVEPTPDFMSGTIAAEQLNINTGVNQELEAELIRQKQLEEEERLKNLQEEADYSKYAKKEDNHEYVYRAAGKSIVREKQKKEPIDSISPVTIKEIVVDEIPEVVNIDEELEKEPKNIQEAIEDILQIPDLDKIEVPIDPSQNPGVDFGGEEIIPPEETEKVNTVVYDEKKDNFDYDQNFENVEISKSDILVQLKEQADQENRISILARYGEDFCSKDYITNPAIGRADEIKQLILILLTPEKSGILIGKPGIGKTSIVEGLAYQLQRNNVPDALKGYVIVSVKTPSLLGTLPTGETRLQTLVDELKKIDKMILFIDEVHMLVGAGTLNNDSAMDFANMFKESLGRGSIKVIGATTTEEYERYILRDKAFVRRFQKVEVEEPDRDQTIKILLGTLPKIEKTTNAKLKYTSYIQSEIMAFIVDITTEYKRIYGIGSRYPDICLTLLAQAFSQAVFANRKDVTIIDIRRAIENSKNIYPDVIRKELVNFDLKFKDIIHEEELDTN